MNLTLLKRFINFIKRNSPTMYSLKGISNLLKKDYGFIILKRKKKKQKFQIFI